MLVAFLFAALAARLIYIEIVESGDLQARALSQWMRDVPLEAIRGAVYDRNGKLLAGNETTYTVYVRPNAVKDKDKTAAVLAEALNLDAVKVRDKLKSRVSEITLKRNVDKSALITIADTDVTGVYFGQAQKRVYPYGDFMTQVLGFTNIDSDGQTGIEAGYNDLLKGKDGYILTETDLVGRELDSSITRFVPGTDGASVNLTIDYYIQSFAESAVKSALLAHSAKNATCMVMDVNTGEMLALAIAPSFDLNNVPRNDVATLLNNSRISAVSDVFEPGSTFKIVTAAIGLESGAVTRATKAYCSGFHIVDGQRIKCWKTTGHGSQSFDEGVQNSCNVLFMNTALSIGTETFYKKLRELGLTSKTGIDLAGEASGLTIAEASVKNVDLARIGFGQAVAVTPIELLRAAAAVINGGKLVTPYIADYFTSPDGKIMYKNYPSVTTGVISESTSAAMREILEGVVLNGGGKNAQVPGYRIGGKTGTAQKYENGSIARGKYVSTFIGFAPADKPEYIALMVVDEPQGAYYGSVVAAPHIGELYGKLFAYKGIAPGNIVKNEEFPMPDLRGMSVTAARVALNNLGIYFETDGEGTVVTTQIPAPGSKVTKDSIAIIIL